MMLGAWTRWAKWTGWTERLRFRSGFLSFRSLASTGNPRLVRARGFTLLEVLLAMAIFAVCVSALYSSFRVSSRAFEMGRESAEMMQSLRFSQDIVVRDLKSVRFQDKYDEKYMFLQKMVFQNQEQILKNLDDGKQMTIPGLLSFAKDAEIPNFVGLRANLRFVGTQGDDLDTIEFSRYLPSDGTTDNSYLGVERVKYFVADGDLYRQRSRVFRPMQLNPNLGEELVKIREACEAAKQRAADAGIPYVDFWSLAAQGTLPPQFMPSVQPDFFVEVPQKMEPPELLARNVTVFDLSYGFYADEQWKETGYWDSDAKQFRTPPFDFLANDPLFTSRLQNYQQRTNDNLPSYVKIRIRMQQKGEQGKTALQTKDAPPKPGKSKNLMRELQTTVWLPGAIETFVPREFETLRTNSPAPSQPTER
jgi:prepilin-type N-terminal cleavage/methylation domain-containing protein